MTNDHMRGARRAASTTSPDRTTGEHRSSKCNYTRKNLISKGLFQRQTVDPARLTWQIENGPPHLAPLWLAVRDGGCELLLLSPDTQRIPKPRQLTIALVMDDLGVSRGPEAFCQATLGRFIAQCGSVVIVACGPNGLFYDAAAARAILSGSHTVLIETLPEHEIAWINFVQESHPGVWLLVGTVPHGQA